MGNCFGTFSAPEPIAVVKDPRGATGSIAHRRKHRDVDDCYKYIIIGDSGVGKSCILHMLLYNRTHDFISGSTIGVEFGSKVVNCGDNKEMKLQIWDTAGQERFRAIVRSYYRGVVGVILVYDITNRESFNNLSIWLKDCRRETNPSTVIMLVGNKKDLEKHREVSTADGERFARQNSLYFREVSAVTNSTVAEVFEFSAQEIYERTKRGELDLDNL